MFPIIFVVLYTFLYKDTKELTKNKNTHLDIDNESKPLFILIILYKFIY